MATSRLQKKVAREGEGAYGNLLESFVTVGTALPSLATASKDGGEFKPLWEQEATDEKGRRRFHGAFTGGFSAGYGGTVGSKEGWTPSTFKSSRGNRASEKGKSTLEQAQGFMDEEDLAELASSRTLATAEAYAAPERYDPLLGTAPALETSSTAALASLIQPSSSRIGAQLMRKMGWRDGQGVGPRVTLAQRREQARELGKKLEEEEEEDGEAARHFYAPLDRPLVLVPEVGVATDRGWGLGYRPGPTLAPSAARQAPHSSSIGLAYDEDEGGVYDDDPMAGRHNVGIVDLDDEENDGFKGSSSRASGSRSKPSTPLGMFHDGSKVLPGFIVVHEPTKLSSVTNHLVAPPRNWQPNPSRLWATLDPSSSGAKGKDRQLDADERGLLLGEKPPPKSVFDYLSQRDKERIATMKSDVSSTENSAPPSNGTKIAEPLPPPPPRPAEPLFPGLIGGRLTKGPSSMLAGRFTISRTGDNAPKIEPGLYQPAPKPEGSVPSEDATAPAPLPEEKATLAQQAARRGDFGVMTRTVETFRPNRLVCKRFGVPDPWEGRPEERDEGVGGAWKEAGRTAPAGAGFKTTEVLGQSSMEALMQSTGFRRFQPPAEPEEDSGATSPEKSTAPSQVVDKQVKRAEPPTLATVGLGDDETQGQDTLTYTKAPQDIFAAIFADSDSDSDDDDEDDEEPVPTSKPQQGVSLPRPAAALDILPPSTATAPVEISTPSPPLPPPPPDDSDTVLSVDTLSSYRPSFVKTSKVKETAEEGEKGEGVHKKKKKKRSAAATLSFAVDDDEEGLTVRPVKKKVRVEEREGKVEKEKVEAQAPAPDPLPKAEVGSNKRARASDLFD